MVLTLLLGFAYPKGYSASAERSQAVGIKIAIKIKPIIWIFESAEVAKRHSLMIWRVGEDWRVDELRLNLAVLVDQGRHAEMHAESHVRVQEGQEN